VKSTVREPLIYTKRIAQETGSRRYKHLGVTLKDVNNYLVYKGLTTK
jgi:hypothetical protein